MLYTDINHNAVTFEDIKNCVFSCLDQDSTVISSLASHCLSIFLGLWVSFFFFFLFMKITVTLLECKPWRANLLNASLKATYYPVAKRKPEQ